jgi:hypothetical protein
VIDQSLYTNFPHLQALLPERPKRNLAANASTMSMSDDDPMLAPQIRWKAIGDGRSGTRQTMDWMAELAREALDDPAFVKFVHQYFSSVEDLEAWTRSHFTYRDEREELLRTPVFMLSHGMQGDCDDVATFLAAAARALGCPARLVAIRYDPSHPDFEHVFAQAYKSGEWLTLDPTVDTDTTIQSVEDMIVAV